MAYKRKRSNSWANRAQQFASGVYQGYTTAKQLRSSYKQNRSARNLRTDGRVITGENDSSRTYRYKRMPRRKRQRWVRFTKQVFAVQQKSLGSNYLVLTRQQTLAAGANKQAATCIHTALGLNGSAFSNDINTLAGRAASLSTSAVADQIKFMVTGWMMETQIVNSSSGTAYVDMYYWRCKWKAPRTVDGIATDAVGLISAGFGDLGTAGAVPTGGSGLDINDYGVTPFQSPQFYKTCRVYKKIRVKLAPGGVTQVEQRSGKNYMRNWGIDEDYGMDKCTEGILMITYGTPSSTNATSDNVNLFLSTNVNYTYKVLNSNSNRGGTNAP